MSSAVPLGSSDAPTPASLIPLVASISPELESEKKGQTATLQFVFLITGITLRISTEVSPLKK